MKMFKDTIKTRISTAQIKKMRQLIRAFPERWESESHFIRSAIIHFERHLDNELIQIRIEKKHKVVKK